LKELKAYVTLFITVVLFGMLAIVSGDNDNIEYNYKVTHVYEDGCLDLYDNENKQYYFYCDHSDTFYGDM